MNFVASTFLTPVLHHSVNHPAFQQQFSDLPLFNFRRSCDAMEGQFPMNEVKAVDR